MPQSEENNWVGGLLALAAGALGTGLFMLFNQNRGGGNPPPAAGPFTSTYDNNQQPPPPPPSGPKKSGCGCGR